VIFSTVVDGATRKGTRCLITAHRIEIIEQITEALAGLGVPHGVIAPGYPSTPEPVQVASISTLVRRIDQHRHYDLIVVDEAHHAVAGSWRKVIQAMPKAKVLGVTATPERLDGRGLGDIFDRMVMGPTTADLIAQGHLSPFTAYAPVEAPDVSSISTRAGDFAVDELAATMARPVIIGAAVDAYQGVAHGKRAVVYGVNIQHSEMLAERFRDRGYRAVHLDGNVPRDQRRKMIQALGTGEIQIICNCGLISEGLDVPGIEAVLLVRPTQSVALYLQQVGRALRLAPSKDRALILDCSGNIWRHGLPDAPREWSLREGKPRKQRESGNRPRLRVCECCEAINPPRSQTCSTCGSDLKPTPQEMREIAAELQRIEDLKRIEHLRSMRYIEAIEWAGNDYAKLTQVAAARGYKPGWVWHQQRAA
jgi:superfamily II DNA or RNA helicase